MLLYCDIVLTILFTIKMVLKIASFGFFAHKGSYLRNGWNILDFVIVIVSILALVLTGEVNGLFMACHRPGTQTCYQRLFGLVRRRAK